MGSCNGATRTDKSRGGGDTESRQGGMNDGRVLVHGENVENGRWGWSAIVCVMGRDDLMVIARSR